MGERESDPKSLWCMYVVLVAEVCVRVWGPNPPEGRRRTVRESSSGEEKEEVKKSSPGGRPLLSLVGCP
jgi:hypothetical protein